MADGFEVLDGFLIKLVEVKFKAAESLLIEHSPLELGLETIFILFDRGKGTFLADA